MRSISIDASCGMAYIQFEDSPVAYTLDYGNESKMMTVDIDITGRYVGIEIDMNTPNNNERESQQ